MLYIKNTSCFYKTKNRARRFTITFLDKIVHEIVREENRLTKEKYMKPMTYPVQTNSSYYMYDRNTNVLHFFPTETAFIEYLAKLTKYPFHMRPILLDDLINSQNFSGNDKERYHVWDWDVYNRSKIIENIRPFTFYKKTGNHVAIINIAEYKDAITTTWNTLFYKKRNPYKQTHHFSPYQSYTHGHKSPKNHLLDEEESVYVKPSSRRKKGYIVYKHEYHDKKYSNRSERSWKKQTKQKHQHGNGSRNKFQEAEFVNKNEYDINRLLETDFYEKEQERYDEL